MRRDQTPDHRGRGRTFESCRAHGSTKPFLKARSAETNRIRPRSHRLGSARAQKPGCPRPRGPGLLGFADSGPGRLGRPEDALPRVWGAVADGRKRSSSMSRGISNRAIPKSQNWALPRCRRDHSHSQAATPKQAGGYRSWHSAVIRTTFETSAGDATRRFDSYQAHIRVA